MPQSYLRPNKHWSIFRHLQLLLLCFCIFPRPTVVTLSVVLCAMASFADGSSSAMGTKHTAQIPNSVQKQHRDNLMSQPSFYQRELPQTCVAFASGEGKKLFRSALENEGLKSFYNLIEQHHTQTEPAFCGVSTCTCITLYRIDECMDCHSCFSFYPCSLHSLSQCDYDGSLYYRDASWIDVLFFSILL